MRCIIAFLFLYLLVHPTKSCVNLFDYRLNGGYIEASEMDFYLDRILEDPLSLERQLETKKVLVDFPINRWTDERASDYAALLMKDLQLAKSKAILDTLLRKDSTNYTYNANYGTLMELMGNNTAALKYIQRALSIDRHSHRDSEWIHVFILKAKIRLEKEKDWLQKNSILQEKIPFNPDKKYAERIIIDLMYQLFERTYFIHPKDEVVADLFYTLGQMIMKADRGVVLARKAFRLSVMYGTNREKESRLQLYLLSFFPSHYYDEDLAAIQNTLVGMLLVSFIFIFLLVFIVRQRKKNLLLKSRDQRL